MTAPGAVTREGRGRSRTLNPTRRVSAIDPGRLRRALELDVELVEGRTYLVTGGAEPHVVEGQACDCADAHFHRGVCKHRLAVYLHARLDPMVLDALRAVVAS